MAPFFLVTQPRFIERIHTGYSVGLFLGKDISGPHWSCDSKILLLFSSMKLQTHTSYRGPTQALN